MPSFSYSPNCNDSVFVIININKLYPCFMAINLVPSLLFIIICTIVFLHRQMLLACPKLHLPTYHFIKVVVIITFIKLTFINV